MQLISRTDNIDLTCRDIEAMVGFYHGTLGLPFFSQKMLSRIHNEFVREPYPAWSAVGVAELVDRCVIEISVVAELPED